MINYFCKKEEMTLTAEEQKEKQQQRRQQIIDYRKHYSNLTEAEKTKFDLQRKKESARNLKIYRGFLAGKEYRQFKREYEAFCRNKATSATDKARS